MMTLLPKQLAKRRWVALGLSRFGPALAPERTTVKIVDDSEALDLAPPFLVAWPASVGRPRVGLVQDAAADPYWTKYRRFLTNNAFPFRMIDLHSDSWRDRVVELDVVVWRPGAQLWELEEARRKIFHMNEFLGIPTYPTLRALTLFNDKLLGTWALQNAGAETPETVASFDESDALERVESLGPELVWKVATGSGSAGVERLSARRARAAVRQAFSTRGRKTYWPYANQKGYVYAQTLERDLPVDMRIIVVGPLCFGYYRDTPRGDFRASGMGLVRREGLPADALEEAWLIAGRLDVGAVAVDFITDPGLRRRKAIEFSSYIRVDDPEELRVQGVPGVYVREGEGRFVFREGRFWFPEVALAEALGRACGFDAGRMLVDSIMTTARSGAGR